MKGAGAWVTDDNVALVVDLYELTMAQAYWRERMTDTAVFTLFCRHVPHLWSHLLACGLDDVLHCLEAFRFDDDALAYLSSQKLFEPAFLDALRDVRFAGDVYAVPEGTPVFANEPILEVVAPLIEAQLVETVVMNQAHMQTVLATAASHIVTAAQGRQVVDFGLRRIAGADAGLKSARAFFIAGVAATSNVLAGATYGIPIAGTMAHSYVQAHEHEIDAFRSFLALYPDATLLVDTYDTVDGVRRVIELAHELGSEFRARAVRLDSGDLGALAQATRRLLDEAGLRRMEIFASGGLSASAIAELVAQGAPIDGFGVGTAMGNAIDAPALDMAYKLSAYAGRARLKTSPGKETWPGQKQVYRFGDRSHAVRDVIAQWDEPSDAYRSAQPLLRCVMRGGRRTSDADDTLARARERAQRERERERTALHVAGPYPVSISATLERSRQKAVATITGRLGASTAAADREAKGDRRTRRRASPGLASPKGRS